MHPPFVNERGSERPGLFCSWLAGPPAAKASLVMVLSLLVIHGLVWSFTDPEAVLRWFWLSKGDEIELRLWKFVTYAFIHGNFWHVMFNALGLLIVGSKVERIAGSGGMMGVFLTGVVLGGAMQLLLAPPAQVGMPLVGASGGIAALLLWLTTVSPELRTWPVKVSGRNLGRGVVVAELGFLALSWFLPEAGLNQVAHACHLGGALAGWGWGRRMFRRLPTLEDLKKERARRESADGPLG